MLTCSRAGIAIGSAIIIAVGLLIAIEGAPLVGLLTVVIGVVGAAIVLVERMRYHADTETVTARAGSPGGVAPGEQLEPRFRPTSEVFVDPTTARRMRVYADPATGERRYRPEG